jgi:hypothetical protein
MVKTFMMKVNEIQPSQLYISSEKLSRVEKSLDATNPSLVEPIPIKKLANDVVFVDGHTRAFTAFLRGFPEVPVYWEDEELDWDAYEVCVRWCQDEGIHTIGDLRSRVVSEKDYETLWYARCEEMQRGLAERRTHQEHQ